MYLFVDLHQSTNTILQGVDVSVFDLWCLSTDIPEVARGRVSITTCLRNSRWIMKEINLDSLNMDHVVHLMCWELNEPDPDPEPTERLRSINFLRFYVKFSQQAIW